MPLYDFVCKSCGAKKCLLLSLKEYEAIGEVKCDSPTLDGIECNENMERELAPNRGLVLGQFRADNGYKGDY